MAKTTDIIESFELILKENASNQQSALYNGNKQTIFGNNASKMSKEVDQVISHVSRQIRAIQSADCPKNMRSAALNINKYEKSSFIPINVLGGSELMPQNTNLHEFETQCVTDTQLINIVQDAEELVSHRGMTQEFDTTFCTQVAKDMSPVQKVTDNDDSNDKMDGVESQRNNPVNDKDTVFPIIDISLKKIDQNDDIDSLFDEEGARNDEQVFAEMVNQTQLFDKPAFIQIDNQSQPEILEKNFVKEEKTKHYDFRDRDFSSSPVLNVKSDLPSSPVFNIKSEKKSTTTSPLVFELEAFEKFEEIAIPIVNFNTDQETAKCIINSQILGKELYLQLKNYNCKESEQIFYEDAYVVSPVIEFSETKFNFDQLVEYLPAKNDNYTTETKSTHSSKLKDEILFSSDEENESELQYYVDDLPFTCALETSFYEQPNILDKTMYVGFQTASNKSIQICTESFYKAKSILDDCEQDVSGKPSLTELVKMCDRPNSTAIQDSIKNNGDDSITINKKAVCRDTIDFIYSKDKETTSEHQPVDHLPTLRDYSEKSIKMPQFEGFKTASNKKIYLSEKALQHSKKILKDIDLSENENCDLLTIKEINCKTTDNIFESKITEKKSPVLQQGTIIEKKELKLDNNILLEFENNDMLHDIDRCNGLVGFKTASNKIIQISESASEKTKKIFQDIDVLYNVNDTKTKNIDFVQSKLGFKTASNKEIKISDHAVANIKSIFQDIEALDEKYIDLRYTEKQSSNIDFEKVIWNQPSPSTTFVGFKTANNKEIKISDVVLSKAKKVFEDIGSDDVLTETNYVKLKSDYPKLARNKRRFDDIDNKTNISEYSLKTNDFFGFQTASNKKIKISGEAMMKSRDMFEEIKKDATGKDSADKLIRKRGSNGSKTQFEGFQTASNKPVNISKDALKKSKAILEKNEDYIDVIKNTSKSNKSPTIFIGFHTASNKPINISEQALIKSKKIFENIDKEIDDNEITGVNSFKGVNNAHNNLITVSEETLVNSSKIFDNIDDDKEETPFKGFQTGINNKLGISEEALVRSKKIFENIDLDNKLIEKGTGFRGFQTASNKKVNISEQALVRSKKIFENIDVENELIESVKSGAFQGFQTASNKKVNISEKALAKSRKIFESNDQDSKLHDIPINNAFQGIQIGHNKKVNVSKQALTKTCKLHENIGGENYTFDNPKGSPSQSCHTSKEALTETIDIFQDTDMAISQVIPIKSANSIRNISKDSCKESESNLAESICRSINKYPKTDSNTHLAANKSTYLAKDIVYLENVDTQVLNDFDKSLHTEDFTKAITPVKSKRSGSPILSCPKAKRRKKFETPYNKTQKNMATPYLIQETSNHDDIKIQPQIFDNNYKKYKKYNLNDINNIEKDNPATQISVDPYILEHNFENLLKFEFFGRRNELSNERWTMDDLKKYFLKSVNTNFVPDGWIDNHFKLIIWKLISYEVKFPKTLGVVCTSKNIIEQLKYRYDKELFNSERPALRKIMEKDDVSTKLMVLCVAAVYEDATIEDKLTNQIPAELLLTDGWYCIRASLDRMLSKLVADGKIVVGSKILTSGAELVGCEQGVAPWEDTSLVRLKLSGNSTRRARWNARLGYHGNGAILSHLRDVKPDGGKVAKLRVLVTRVYPTLYIEKFDDGSTVTRSERLELLHQMKYENERQGLLEKLYEEVQKEFSDEVSQDSEVDPELKQRCSDSGSQIARAMKKSKDPSEFRSNLTETQVELLKDHTTRKRDRLIQDIQARVEERIAASGLNVRRNVVPLMKIRVADVRERDNVEVTKGLMSIWKPNDAIAEIVKEGSWIEVMNVIPTAIRYSEIQISAGRQSIFCQSKHKESEKVTPYTKSMRRTCYLIKDLSKNPSMTTEYNEIDTVGLIFLIEPSIKEFDSNKNQFQNVYLTDADKNIICVNFWGGLKKLGVENILDTGQVVACMNLQKRAGNTRKSIPQYRVTEFSYFTKTPKNDTARNASEDLDKKLQGVDRMKFCDECVALKNNYSVFKQNYSENVSPYRYQDIDMNLSKNKMFIDSPLVANNVKNDENFNLSGLDFESTFKQIETQEYSPKTILRKRQIQEKIDKLKMYGEPPALSPMQILNKSKNAGSAFKSPLPKSDLPNANTSEILLKETNVESGENPGSPVIINRTFVKRINMNPVKLDFNSVAIDNSDTIDHFAEEFDGSPPLSLD